MSCQNDPISQINSAMQTAIHAQEAGDFRTAERKARTAWMLLASIPDSEHNNERLEWNRESVGAIVKELAKRARAQPADGESRGALIRPIYIGYQRG